MHLEARVGGAPHFSVVVPAYNAESTLAETLDGILRQKSEDWECILVDDGSTDSTLAIANSFAARDTRIRVLHQQNQGSAGAYNAGTHLAAGDFVVVCSADDILLPDHITEMSAFVAAEPEYDIYTSNGYFLKPDGSRDLVYDPKKRGRIDSLRLSDVIRTCFYGVGATYRRDLLRATGGYRPEVFGEDYDFWLRAMAAGARHRYTPKALSLHRVSPAQKSADLETAYQSDMRILSDLRRDSRLSDEEVAAIEESLATRKRWIADLRAPQMQVRRARRQKTAELAAKLIGERAVHRVGNWLRRPLH